MQRLIFIPFIILFSLHFLFSQDIHYAHEVIDTLTSPYMAGRGYVNNGHAKAAGYIKNEFEQIGLTPFQGRFFQPFTFSINTFPEDITVSIEKQLLIPGKDYLVAPESPSLKGKFNLVYVDSLVVQDADARNNFFQNKLTNSFLVIDPSYLNTPNDKLLLDSLKANSCGARGIIMIEPKKLTWHMSQTVSHFPTIIILKDAMPANAQTISLSIENHYNKKSTSQNVIGYVKGSLYPDSFIVLTAHYDHLGMMGSKTYFPGANDNASGVSMLLNLAKYYADTIHKPAYSIVFIAFAAEEVGLLGSEFYTEYPLFPLTNIKFLLNMDLLGTGDDGLMVVNGKEYTALYDTLSAINTRNSYLPVIKSRGKAANSDHYWFTEKGVKSFFIYTMGGISAYHDIYDKAATLPLTDYSDVFKLIVDFVEYLDK